MSQSYIHVGLGDFSFQRLEMILSENLFEPVAFVDLKVEESKRKLNNLKNLPEGYSDRVFETISEARKNFNSEVVIIYVSSDVHCDLVCEALNLGLNVFCVKSIANNLDEFEKILSYKKKSKDLILVQGHNNQWNEASLYMQKLLKNKSLFGNFISGYCNMWGMQNLSGEKTKVDVTQDGIYFHSMGVHQLSQLVMAIGLPKSVRSISPVCDNKDLGYSNSIRTSGGSCFFDYGDNRVFTYVGNRAGHGNPFGFASRWSGIWMFHGTNADIYRDRGRITIYKKGNIIQDLFLKDLDLNLIEDEKVQLKQFKNQLNKKFDQIDVQRSSLETWILMEACNISSRENKEINIQDLINKVKLYEIC